MATCSPDAVHSQESEKPTAVKPVPVGTAAAAETHMPSLEQFLKALDDDDPDTRYAARDTFIRYALQKIERTGKPLPESEKENLQPQSGAHLLEVNAQLALIREAIDTAESKLLLPATIFHAPAHWNKPGANVAMKEALDTLGQTTELPISLKNASSEFLGRYVRVDNLDGLTFWEALTRIGTIEGVPPYCAIVRGGHLLVQHDDEIRMPHRSRACNGPVCTTVRIGRVHPHQAALTFSTEPRWILGNTWIQKVQAVLPNGKSVPVRTDAQFTHGFLGPNIILPQAETAGQTVTLTIHTLMRFHEITTVKIHDLDKKQVCTEEFCEARFCGTYKEDEHYVVEFDFATGRIGLPPEAAEHFGCTAIGPNGLPMICTKIEKPLHGKPGKCYFSFDKEPQSVLVHIPALGKQISRTQVIVAKGIPLSTEKPVEME